MWADSGEHEKIQRVIDAVFSGKQRPVILEAGCGSRSHVHFPSDARIVGIDISEDQLIRNQGLDERIQGDIQSYEFPEQSFDAIVCWDVLEHLARPEAALERFGRAIRDDGVIILSGPNPLSAKGIITKLTPYRFHIWFYRNLRGLKEAGTPGNPPFPTYLRLSITPNAIKKFARRNGLAVLHESVFGYGDSRDVISRKSRAFDVVMKALNATARALSLGRIHPEATQCYFVLQRKATRGSK
ncbi:MAG TPA: class I SAM-dependent methyltransferase [bacterium]|nr:class I SAM-dependent methyltransferase [bacterium]